MIRIAADTFDVRAFMKRFLPFLIILIVGLATIGIATAVYEVKMRPNISPATTPSPVKVAAKSPPQSTAPPVADATAAAPLAPANVEPPFRPDDESSQAAALHVRGPSTAPLTVEIYGDFQCPTCAVTSMALDELANNEFAGKIRIVYHEFPLSIHSHSVQAAEVAEAAGLQGRFWEMHDMLYKYQDSWSRITNPNVFFDAYAQQLGLDMDRFRADRQSDEIEGKVIEEGNSGLERGVRNTPTIFINGVEAKGAYNKDKLREVIEAALAKKNQAGG
jgi:protein-disulfide isomerase